MRLGPGTMIGIVGGGQLGRMLSMAAADLGMSCHIYDPHEFPCAAQVAKNFTRGSFDDCDALRRFASACDVVTYEFENLAVEPLEALGDKLRPGARSLEVGQDRATEKRFVEACGATPAPWRTVDSPDDIVSAIAALGGAIILKTRRFGYDGKGQVRVDDPTAAGTAWEALGKAPSVAEKVIDFEAEFSVVLARSLGGEIRPFPIPRNVHQGGVLRTSSVPAGAAIDKLSDQAIAQAARIAEELGHVGVFTVEFFACAQGPLVNEFAPRVHNSGHWTIEGARTSQFEQHIRAICGLPLGDPGLVTIGATMQNLIGADLDDWPALIAEPGARLHIYGKGEARPGRKMGHVTRLVS